MSRFPGRKILLVLLIAVQIAGFGSIDVAAYENQASGHSSDCAVSLTAGSASLSDAEVIQTSTKKTCMKSGCNKKRKYNSIYCSTHGCAWSGCSKARLSSGIYCSEHKKIVAEQQAAKKSSSSSSSKSSSSSSSKSSSAKSYDEGYDAVYEDDDYDYERYKSDSSYAAGVDDALEDLEDEGEGW